MDPEEIISLMVNSVKGIKDMLAVPYVFDTYKDPFKVLIATIISIRVREEKTIEVCNRLFSVYKTVDDFKRADKVNIESLLKDIGLYRQKAKWIKEIASVWDYNKQCDENFIRSLPGVGRKVANVYLSLVCNKDYIAVDTHVHRIFNRLGLVKTSSPEDTEEELYKIFPKKYWKEINRIGVLFGRNICKPKNPRCDICSLNSICNYYRSNVKTNKS